MKLVLVWFGRLLSVLGLVFVVFRLRAFHDQITGDLFARIGWVRLAWFTLLYGILSILLGLSWREVLSFVGAGITRLQALRIYGMSQISKYVPGNIFHLAGRQSMGMAIGVPAWSLVKSAFWEFAVLLAIGGLFGVLALPAWVPGLEEHASLVLIGFACSSILCLVCFLRAGAALAKAFVGYWIFLLGTGLFFTSVFAFLVPESPPVPLVCGAYVFALIVGLATPGAPAGLGVREWILVLLFRNRAEEAAVLLAVLLGRIISVGGDILFFAVATFLPKVQTGVQLQQNPTRRS